MPSTFVMVDHNPHRHRVTMNEGPTDNVLCLGYPGNPQGYAPEVRLVYPGVE